MTTYAPTSAPAVAGARDTRRRASAQAWNLAATAVIWLTSLYVVALWVSGGGLQAIAAGSAETLTTLGRITGLVSANLLLYQVLLMARVPLFERGFGRDGITRMHRLVGFWSFWLLIAHIVLITAGYSITAGLNPFVQLWEFIVDYPGMLLATASTVLLILVVVTAMQRARRRLRYESWHLLHLYGYLGVGLALPHQLWTGADFLSSPAATAYWWTLWAAVAASVAHLPDRDAAGPIVAVRPAGAARRRRRCARGHRGAWAERRCTACAPSPASSSCGGSSTAPAGAAATRSRSRGRRTPTVSRSPPASSATAPHDCGRCARAPACSSRDRTAG